jgi:RNA polymerase sigma-70 factor (ECF subfamily)
MQPDDIRLVQAAKQMDGNALQTIFDTYAPAIYNYSLRLCQDAVEADNIVGDVFALLIEQFAKGKGPETNLRSYLYQTAYRLIIDHSRERKHISALDMLEQTGNEDPSVVFQSEHDAEVEALIQAMNTAINEDQRHVLVLRFVEGFNVEETARITGKSIANVKVIQSRGVDKLRQALNRRFNESS